MMTTPESLRKAPIHALAALARQDWGSRPSGVYFAAKPYLAAMEQLTELSDSYGADSGAMIVRYFLANARSWSSPMARVIKAELRRRLEQP